MSVDNFFNLQKSFFIVVHRLFDQDQTGGDILAPKRGKSGGVSFRKLWEVLTRYAIIAFEG